MLFFRLAPPGALRPDTATENVTAPKPCQQVLSMSPTTSGEQRPQTSLQKLQQLLPIYQWNKDSQLISYEPINNVTRKAPTTRAVCPSFLCVLCRFKCSLFLVKVLSLKLLSTQISKSKSNRFKLFHVQTFKWDEKFTRRWWNEIFLEQHKMRQNFLPSNVFTNSCLPPFAEAVLPFVIGG